MAKFNIQINIPIEMNTDDLGIKCGTLENHLQWSLERESSYRPPFHIEMLFRGFHETLKLAVQSAVEDMEEAKYEGEYIDVEHESKSGGTVSSHTPIGAVTAPPIYKRFRIEKMDDWNINLKETSMSENSLDPLYGLPGQMESLQEENTKLQAEIKTLKGIIRRWDKILQAKSMAEQAMDAYHAGNFTPLSDVIDELKGKVEKQGEK